MDDNDKQMTLPGMEDSDELTNPLTSSTKELVTELLQDAAQLSPQRRALCTLLLTCARTIDRLWVPEQRLFLRDQRFKDRTEANLADRKNVCARLRKGKKC